MACRFLYLGFPQFRIQHGVARCLFYIVSIFVMTGCGLATMPSTPTPTATADAVASANTQSVASRDASAPAPIVTPVPEPAPTDTPIPGPMPQPEGAIDVALVQLRSAPSLDSAILGAALRSTRIRVMAQNVDASWLLVCCPLEGSGPGWLEATTVLLDTPAITANTLAEVAALVTEPVTTTVDAVASAAAVADPSVAESVTGLVTGSLVNLRGGPGTNYGIVGQAQAGTSVNVVGRTPDQSWWRVCCPAGEATESWIFADLMELRRPAAATIEDIPLVEAPASTNTTVTAAPNLGTGGQVGQPNPVVNTAPQGLPGQGSFGPPGGTNPLTGLSLAGGRAGQRPVVVCINNDFAARPQFGMSQADVVYEYVMEGYSITRFSAIYYGDDVAQIGPVRSARLINYYMGALYNAGVVASGASDGVRFLLREQAPFPYLDVDLDDPSNTRYVSNIGRDYRTRLRTSTGQLRNWLAAWGQEQPATIRGFTFGGLPGGGAGGNAIRLPFPSATASQSAFQFDGNRYLRSMGGFPHTDGNTGAQLAFENVVVQYVPHETTDIVEDSLGSRSIRLNLFGSGRAIIFRDGQSFDGTWRSATRGDTPHFFKADGAEVPLKPGRTWIAVVPFNYAISYQ